MIFLIACYPGIIEAQEWAKNYKTQYSTIYYSTDKDLYSFTRNIESGFSFFSESPEKNPTLVKKKVDRVVERIAELLDMHPPDLYFNIYLYQTYKNIENAYKKIGIFGKAPIAFYSHRTKAIYVSLENITDRILAHEIAHAIINFYFGTPPPAKMQEILAQYVDKYLGKD